MLPDDAQATRRVPATAPAALAGRLRCRAAPRHGAPRSADPIAVLRRAVLSERRGDHSPQDAARCARATRRSPAAVRRDACPARPGRSTLWLVRGRLPRLGARIMSPANEEPAATPPQYERFEDEETFQQAVDRLLGQSGRELRIFDPDLSGLRLNMPERIARLQRFLIASRTRRIYIAMHDTDYIGKYCPRMRDLLARYAHAIQVQQTDEEIREVQDAFLVLDANHYV